MRKSFKVSFNKLRKGHSSLFWIPYFKVGGMKVLETSLSLSSSEEAALKLIATDGTEAIITYDKSVCGKYHFLYPELPSVPD